MATHNNSLKNAQYRANANVCKTISMPENLTHDSYIKLASQLLRIECRDAKRANELKMARRPSSFLSVTRQRNKIKSVLMHIDFLCSEPIDASNNKSWQKTQTVVKNIERTSPNIVDTFINTYQFCSQNDMRKFIEAALSGDKDVMMHRINEITSTVVPTYEGQHCEFKKSFRHPSSSNKDIKNGFKTQLRELVKVVVSFANAHQQGTLYVGINDDGTVNGIENEVQSQSMSSLEATFRNTLKQLTSRKFMHTISFAWKTIEGHLVCAIHVPEWHGKAILLNENELYVRSGASVHQVA